MHGNPSSRIPCLGTTSFSPVDGYQSSALREAERSAAGSAKYGVPLNPTWQHWPTCRKLTLAAGWSVLPLFSQDPEQTERRTGKFAENLSSPGTIHHHTRTSQNSPKRLSHPGYLHGQSATDSLGLASLELPLPIQSAIVLVPLSGSDSFCTFEMPAIMDDPASPTIYRVSGPAPYPEPGKPGFPANIQPRQVTLRDRQTIATVVPFASSSQVPPSLLKYLSDQFAKEIEGGDTYPMIEPMALEQFSKYWFQNFAAIMLLGTIDSAEQVVEGKDWSKECLGSFYIKPNYPGRSSHVCNAGFLVTEAARNRGVGRLMGESYLDWAPKLEYTYSVFNLVYETNVASCKIWDGLGFKRIGRVKGCGNLKSYPDRLVDAIIYGRDLGEAAGDGADGPVSEERFDKIKFYLKYGKYPNGSDRAEKSRLRSAATHYKLLENDVLMLKDKEVISDPVRQMDIAKQVHQAGSHAGINKTTATIAERYHWSRIKETVSDVIRLCSECKELCKVPLPNTATRKAALNADVSALAAENAAQSTEPEARPRVVRGAETVLDLRIPPTKPASPPPDQNTRQYDHQSDLASLLNPEPLPSDHLLLHEPLPHMTHDHRQLLDATSTLSVIPYDPVNLFAQIDPQIIAQSGQHDVNDHFDAFHELTHHHSPHATHEPYDVHLQTHHPPPDDHDTYLKLQALLNDDPGGIPNSIDPRTTGHHHAANLSVHVTHHDQDQDAVDRDIDMLLEQHDDSDLLNLDGDVGTDPRQEEREHGLDIDTNCEKRDRRGTLLDDDRSPKRRNWDHVIFDVS
ncbi:histone acetyltransferase spt10 [Seiridium cupressi]